MAVVLDAGHELELLRVVGRVRAVAQEIHEAENVRHRIAQVVIERAHDLIGGLVVVCRHNETQLRARTPVAAAQPSTPVDSARLDRPKDPGYSPTACR